MSLFNDATFILIPSGYKAGKLYAEKPVNGNGDLTWSRNSTANRTNSSVVIESVDANVPRLSYMYGSCPSALLEPQRTNIIRNSTMVGAVSGTPGTLPNNYTVLTGGLTRSIVDVGVENGLNYIDIRLQGTATGILAQIVFDSNTSNNASAGQTYIFSLYSKLISGSANSYSLIWDEFSSTPTYLTSKATSVSLTSTTTRFSLSGTTAASCVTIQPYLRFALTIGNVYDFTFRVLQPQLELGAYFTTPIFTSGTFATRVADTFIRNNIYTNGLISSSGGTWYIELINNLVYTRDNSSSAIYINTGTSPTLNDGFLFRNTGTSRLNVVKVVSSVLTTLFTTSTNNLKVAIKWNGTTADIFVNGIKVVTDTPFTTLDMERLGGGPQVPTFIQAMALFNEPKSDVDCEIMTGTSYNSYSAMATALGYTVI